MSTGMQVSESLRHENHYMILHQCGQSSLFSASSKKIEGRQTPRFGEKRTKSLLLRILENILKTSLIHYKIVMHKSTCMNLDSEQLLGRGVNCSAGKKH